MKDGTSSMIKLKPIKLYEFNRIETEANVI